MTDVKVLENYETMEGVVSLKPIRDTQDYEVFKQIIKGGKYPQAPKQFIWGSVDGLLNCKEGVNYSICETNGTSQRGFSVLPLQSLERVVESYQKIVEQLGLVVFPVLPNDALIQERLLFQNCAPEGVKVELVTYNEFKEYVKRVNGGLYLNGEKIDLIIGDGAPRRYPDMFQGLEGLVLNGPIIQKITDNKGLTQDLVTILHSQNCLETTQPLTHKNCSFNSVEELVDEIRKFHDEKGVNAIVIKPEGGSGGAGVIPLSLEWPIQYLKKGVERSVKEYETKFGKPPQSYEVVELINSPLIDFATIGLPGKRVVDIRTYLCNYNGRIVPAGFLLRIGKRPVDGNCESSEDLLRKQSGNGEVFETFKEAIVVNLSGYGGIDYTRGRGVNLEVMKTCGEQLDTDSYELFGNIGKDASTIFSNMILHAHNQSQSVPNTWTKAQS